ncbi:MAG TPA: hypothetical protein EYQ42_02685 [Thiotrichaceae bacterium]|jgi:DnaJ-class molecular chaperone|nr:hypothetical protein [Thiotrichaceae bacterium]
MKINNETNDIKYFVTGKTICSECKGTGVSPQSSSNQLLDKQTAILKRAGRTTWTNCDFKNNLNHEIYSICLICDGSGQLKNDVPLKIALLEVRKELTNINEENCNGKTL